MEGESLIGIDTNVLLRFVLRDDPIQSQQAKELFAAFAPRDQGYLSLIVLCEFAWTLGRFYRYGRAEIAETLEQILRMTALEVEHPALAQRALDRFRASRADFGDCCIGVLAETAGCAYTVTFDRDASKLPGMRLLGESGA